MRLLSVLAMAACTALVALVWLPEAAAQEVSISSTGSPGYGTYEEDGGFVDNYGFVGFRRSAAVPDGTALATYITFDLSELTDNIIDGHLRFVRGTTSLADVESFVVHAVNTPVATLEAGDGSYESLVGGAVLGSTSVGPESPNPLFVDLNAMGLDAVEAAVGGSITVAVDLPTAQGPNESFTGFAVSSTLVLTVPEPTAWLLSVTALLVVAGLRRSRA